MKQTAYVGFGCVRHLRSELSAVRPSRILLVRGRGSFRTSGAEDSLSRSLEGHRVHHFMEFGRNPRLEDVERGIAVSRAFRPDLVLAVGGGSVIDMAKLVALLGVQRAEPLAYVTGKVCPDREACPLIAIPTTAGSGSEATHFAVVYHERRKWSVAHGSLLPRVALVDPELTATLPAALTATCGFDTLSQALESYWSVNSTEASKANARRAIRLSLAHLSGVVHRPTCDGRAAMSEAAFLAGRAINVAKTTAPHALSYGMTAWFGVMHGQAVAVTLPHFFSFNAEVTSEDVADPRGVGYVLRTLSDLNALLGSQSADESRVRLQRLMTEVGLATKLEELGISSTAQRRRLIDYVNPQRMANNPRRVTARQLQALIAGA